MKKKVTLAVTAVMAVNNTVSVIPAKDLQTETIEHSSADTVESGSAIGDTTTSNGAVDAELGNTESDTKDEIPSEDIADTDDLSIDEHSDNNTNSETNTEERDVAVEEKRKSEKAEQDTENQKKSPLSVFDELESGVAVIPDEVVSGVAVPDELVSDGAVDLLSAGETSVEGVGGKIYISNNIVVSCDEGLTEIVIPSYVTEIADDAFMNTTDLERVTFNGSSLQKIGKRAFQYQPIESIELPLGLKVIDEEAFSYSNLRSLTIPEGVTTIGGYAFAGCTLLEEIQFKARQCTLGAGIFDEVTEPVLYCYQNSSIDLYSGEVFYTEKKYYTEGDTDGDPVIDGKIKFPISQGYIYIEEQTGLICGFEGEVVTLDELPTSVNQVIITGFKANAFADCKTIETVVCTPDMITIGEGAFNGSSLQSIKLAENTRVIGKMAFKDCSELTNVELPINLESIEESAFEATTALGQIEFSGETLTTIGKRAFWNTGLRAAYLPYNLTTLGDDAFANSTELSNVYIPSSLKTVGNHVFGDCTSLTEIDLGDGITMLGTNMFENSGVETLEIPESLVTLPSGLMKNSSKFYNLIVDGHLDSVAADAFSGCSDFEFVTCYRNSRATKCDYGKAVDFLYMDAIPEDISGWIFDQDVYTESLTGLGRVLPRAITNYDIMYWYWRDHDLKNNVLASKVLDLEYYRTHNKDDEFLQSVGQDYQAIFDHFVETNAESKGALSQNYWGRIYQARYKELDGKNGDELVYHYLYDGIFRGLKATLDSSEMDESGYYLYEVTSADSNKAYLHIKLDTGDIMLADPNTASVPQIPDTLFFYPITKIHDQAFKGCTKLKDVAFSTSITSIGNNAFSGCTELLELSLPGVISIGDGAFQGCTKIETANMPKTQSIGVNAFAGCTKLTSVEMPQVTTIKDGAFQDVDILFWKLPDTVTALGHGVFNQGNTKKVVWIPQGIKTVQSDVINKGIVIVYKGSPADITYAKGVKKCYADTFMAYEVGGGYIYIVDDVVIASDKTVTDVEIPGYIGSRHINEIFDRAFAQRNQLQSLVLGEGISLLDFGACVECENLQEVVLPSTITALPSDAFAYCKELESINLDYITEYGENCLDGCTSLRDVTIAANTTKVASSAFDGQQLGVLTILSRDVEWNPEAIGPNSSPLLVYCYKGSTVDNLSYYPKGSEIRYLKEGNIYNVENGHIYYNDEGYIIGADDTITSADVPSIIKDTPIIGINKGAFLGCNDLKNITFGEGITKLDDNAFEGCSSMTTCTIPMEDVETLGEGVFKGCSVLKRFDLPQGLSAIPASLFEGCTKLQSVTIPKTVTVIGDKAFYGCDGFSGLTIPKVVNQMGKDVFSARTADNKLTVYVYKDSVADNYKYPANVEKSYIAMGTVAVTGGNIYVDLDTKLIIDADPSVTQVILPTNEDNITIGGVDTKAFNRCTSLEVIVLPLTATTISDYAFAGCRNLTAVGLPGVEVFGSSIFNGCTKLQEFYVSKVAKVIAKNIFTGSSITTVHCDNTSQFWNEKDQYTNRNIQVVGSASIPRVTPTGVAADIFDVKYYITHCVDLIRSISCAPEDLYAHWLMHGIDDHKQGVYMFNIDTYYQYNKEIKDKFGSDHRAAFENFIREDYKRKGVSSAEYCGWAYQSRYEDLKGMSAEELIHHYVTIGKEEGRNAKPFALDANGWIIYPVVNGNIYIDLENGRVMKADTGITKAEIPDEIYGRPITVIYDSAFNGCVNLAEVTTGKGITTINTNAFTNNRALKKITMSGVTTVGNMAFKGCTALTDLGLPAVITLGTEAFSGDTQLAKVSLSTVLTVGERAFSGCTGLTDVTLLVVKDIKTGAFNGCSKLATLDMPAVETLADAFNGVAKKIWNLPATLKSVARSTFDKDSIVRMPNTTSTTIDTAFMDSGKVFVYSNSSANRVSYIPAIKKYVVDGTLVIYPVKDGNVYIADGVIITADETITEASIPRVVSGMTVTGVADSAFAGITTLTSCSLPDTVKTINNNAFKGCTNLNTVNTGGATSLNSTMFSGCVSLENVTMKSVVTLGDRTFAESVCHEWVLPDTVKTVGSGVFPAWSKVTLPAAVTSVKPDLMPSGTVVVHRGTYADTNVSYIPTVKKRYTDGYIAYAVTNGNIYVDEVTGMVADADWSITVANIPKSIRDTVANKDLTITGIDISAFAGCSRLTSVTLPDTATNINDRAFYGVPIASIKLPDTLLNIGALAFANTKLTYIEIPMSVTNIGNGAFENCVSLTKIRILPSRVNLGTNLFSITNGRSALTVELYKLSTADKYAYSEVGNTTKIYIDAADFDQYGYYKYPVTGGYLHVDLENGMVMFADATVTGIELPKTLKSLYDITKINKGAFQNHKSLQTVSMPFITEMGADVFDNCDALTTVSLERITTLPSGTFNSCDILTDVTLPNVQNVLTNTFKDCISLREIHLPQCIKLGEETGIFDIFYGCRNLTIADIPKLQVIGQGSFAFTDSLKTMDITNVKSIGAYAYWCSGITDLTIPEATKVINGSAFLSSTLSRVTVYSRDVELGQGVWLNASHLGLARIYRKSTSDDMSIYPVTTRVEYIDAQTVGEDAYDYSAEGYLKYPVTGGFVYIDIKTGQIVKADKSITAIEIPDVIKDATKNITVSVTSIGGSANTLNGVFANTPNLTTVIFSEGLKTIGDGAFYNCTKLKTVEIPGVTTMGKNAFRSCPSLVTLECPEVTSIGASAFYQARSLRSVDLPKIVTIDSAAFQQTCLETITLPESLKTVGDAAFLNLRTLRTYTVYSKDVNYNTTALKNTGILDIYLYKNSTTDKYTGFPTNAVKHYFATDIADGTYDEQGYYLYPVENGYLHIDLKNGIVVFADNSVTGADIPDKIGGYSMRSIADNAFSKSKINWVKFPESLVSVGNNAFRGKSISEVDLTHVQYIGEGAFADTSIDSIKLCDRLSYIGSEAFYNTLIDGNEVVIPASVSSMGSRVFGESYISCFTMLSKNCAYLTDTFGGMTSIPLVRCYKGSTADNQTLYLPTTIIEYIDESIDENGYYLYRVDGGYLHIDLKTGTVMYADGTVTGATVPDVIQGVQIRHIAPDAFTNNTNVKRVNLSYITDIGHGAFAGCRSLDTVIAPKVTSLDYSAFYLCSSLTTISLPELRNVGDNAFSLCTRLKTVEVANATSIGQGAFADCSTLGTLSLPNVTKIGSQAFENCSSLASVDVPKLVTIEYGAFEYAEALQTIDLAETVTTIAEDAFYGDYELTEVYIRNKNAKIGSTAFTETGLGTVHIYRGSTADDASLYPKGTKIQYFDGSMSEDGYYMYAVENGFLYIDLETGTVVRADDTVTGAKIPERVENIDVIHIGEGAFKGNVNLKWLDLNAVIDTEYEAIRECTALQTITAPNLQTIGEKTFRGCTALKEISFPKVKEIESWAFGDCTNLKKATLDAVTYIGSEAFRYSGLASITAPNLKELGGKVFKECPLTSIELRNLTTASVEAFSGCKQLTTAVLPALTDAGIGMLRDCSALKTVDISSLTEIPQEMFYEDTALGSINISKVTEIGNWGFGHCSNLITVTMPNIGVIGDYAFAQSGITNVGTLQKLTSLGVGAFSFSDIKSITAPNCTDIEDKAFDGCFRLTVAQFPKVWTIGSKAFNSTALTSFDMPEVETISSMAFHYADLTSVTLPQSLTQLGNQAFWESSLREITIKSKSLAVPSSTFADCGPLTVYLYKGAKADNLSLYPTGSKIVYLPGSVTEDGLYMYQVEGGYLYIDLKTGTVVRADDTVTKAVIPARVENTDVITVGPQAFSGNTNLKYLDFGSVTTIKAEAVRDCTSLQEIHGKSVVTVEDKAFRFDSALKTVDLPVVKTLYNYTFGDCTSLTSVTLPELRTLSGETFKNSALQSITANKLETINDKAFSKCPLTVVVFPSLIHVGQRAFAECPNLTSVTLAKAREIGAQAFSHCPLLKTVNVPVATTIGDGAFEYDTSLTTLSFPAVTEVGSRAFEHCTGLTSVSIPNLTYLDEYAFAYCSMLGSVGTLNRLTYVGKGAFSYAEQLKAINLPICTDIDDRAFDNCTSLSSVLIPKAKHIGTYAFNRAIFTSINLPVVTDIEERAFTLVPLTSVDLPETLKTLGAAAFATIDGHPTIKTATIRSRDVKYLSPIDTDVTGIFHRHDGMMVYVYHKSTSDNKSLYPDNTTIRYLDAEYSEDGLYKYRVGNGYIYIDLETGEVVRADDTVTTVTVPSQVLDTKVVAIADHVFQNKKQLTTVDLGDVTYIGYEAFRESSIQSITGRKVLTIDDKAFRECQNMTTATFPVVTSIGEYAFAQTSKLTVANMNTVTALGTHAFYCSGVTSVSLNNLKSLPASAFSGCISLRSISIPLVTTLGFESLRDTALTDVSLPVVQTIGKKAFAHCSSLGTVTAKNTKTIEGFAFDGSGLIKLDAPVVATVGEAAFNKCTRLNSVNFGSSVTTIGEEAFEDCDSLTAISLPFVKTVPAQAFLCCDKLKTITLTSATTIGSEAFKECKGLETVSLPAATSIADRAFRDSSILVINAPLVKTLGEWAFASSTLRTVNMAEVTTIGERAFDECTQLSKTNMTKVTSVAGGAFVETESLTEFTFTNKSAKVDPNAFNNSGLKYVYVYYKSTTDNKALYPASTEIRYLDGQYSQDGLYMYPVTGGYVYIDLKTGTIVRADDNITQVVIPAQVVGVNVVKVNNEVFRDKAKLTSVTISGVTTVGDKAFRSCPVLKSVSLPMCTTLGIEAFKESSVADVNIPKVTKIQGCTFQNCSSLAKVTASSATVIEHSGFSACSNLTSATFSTALTTLGNSAFKGCTKLASVNFGGSLTTVETMAFENCSSLQNITLGKVTKIPRSTFYGCSKLAKVSAPNVTSIGERAFDLCEMLSNIDFGSKVTSLGVKAFEDCVSLPSINLSALTTIPERAFNRCLKLTSVTIPKVTSVGEHAFYNSGLTSLNAPQLKTIASDAFWGTKITSITAPLVETIGDGAFEHTKFTKANMPKLISLGTNVFDESALTEFTFENKTATISSGAFDDCPNLKTIYCYYNSTADKASLYPVGVKISYLDAKFSTEGYYMYAVGGGYIYIDLSTGTVVKADDTVTTVTVPAEALHVKVTKLANYVFEGKKKLTSVNLGNIVSVGIEAFRNSTVQTVTGNSVTTIGNSALRDCTSLKTITFPAVTTVGKYAFANTKGLGAVTLNKAITLGESAFRDSGITSLTAPVLKTVEGDAFHSCSSLKTISMPQVTTIKDEAFRETGLTSVNLPALTTTVGRAFGYCSNLSSFTATKLQTIGAGTFNTCPSLVKVDAPNVTTIGEEAFNKCSLLSNINFGSKVTSIGAEAFEQCKALTSISLPLVTVIPERAFNYCSKLSSVYIPKVVTTEEHAFYNCTAMTTLNAPALKNVGTKSFQGNPIKTINAPNVETVGEDAFGHSVFTKVEWTKLKTLTSTALGQTGLTEFTFYNRNTQLTSNAFYLCHNLKKIYCYSGSTADNKNLYPAGVQIIYLDNPVCYFTITRWDVMGRNDGYDVTGKATLDKPMYVDSLRYYATNGGTLNMLGDTYSSTDILNMLNGKPRTFKNGSLTSVSVGFITSNGKITGIEVSGSQTNLDESGMSECFYDINSKWDTKAPLYVFSPWTGTVSISGRVTNVPNLFTSADSESISDTIFADVVQDMFAEPINNTEAETYTAKSEQSDVGSTPIETAISEVAGSDTVFASEVADMLISPLSEKRKYVVDNGYLIDIDKELTKVTIPEGVTVIAANALRESKAKELVIPATVKSIDTSAFADMPNLHTVTFLGKDVKLGANLFAGCDSDLMVYTLKDSTAESYKYDGVNGVVLVQSITSAKVDGETAYAYPTFGGNIYINTDGVIVAADRTVIAVSVPESIYGIPVKAIGHDAFVVSNLMSISLAEGIETIEDNAFGMCYNLSSVELSNGLKSIGNGAFDTTAVHDIEIPESVEEIGNNAFANSKLETITVNSADTKIGKAAFEGCSALTVNCVPESEASTYSEYPSNTTVNTER